MKYKVPLIGTIAGIGAGKSIITKCSAVNSPGNHMQLGVGWYTRDGKHVDRIMNSWGTNHGFDGYTHLMQSCGEGRYNRGWWRNMRAAIYTDTCDNLADAYIERPHYKIFKDGGASVILGREATNGQTCQWMPESGILETLSSDGCRVVVSPEISTEYHLKASESQCGTEASAMTLVEVVGRGDRLLTPHGEVSYEF